MTRALDEEADAVCPISILWSPCVRRVLTELLMSDDVVLMAEDVDTVELTAEDELDVAAIASEAVIDMALVSLNPCPASSRCSS